MLSALPTTLALREEHESLCVATLTKQTEAVPALGALATSIWAASPYSDAASAPFQIQI